MLLLNQQFQAIAQCMWKHSASTVYSLTDLKISLPKFKKLHPGSKRYDNQAQIHLSHGITKPDLADITIHHYNYKR